MSDGDGVISLNLPDIEDLKDQDVQSHLRTSPPIIMLSVLRAHQLGETRMDEDGQFIHINEQLVINAKMEKRHWAAYGFVIGASILHELGHWKFQKYACLKHVAAKTPPTSPLKGEAGDAVEHFLFGGSVFFAGPYVTKGQWVKIKTDPKRGLQREKIIDADWIRDLFKNQIVTKEALEPKFVDWELDKNKSPQAQPVKGEFEPGKKA